MNSSKHNDKQEPKQSQARPLRTRQRDGYIIIQRQILNEGFSAYELSFLITCLLIADHRKSKTPGVVKASTTELGLLMGASQKTAWKCKQALIVRGIIKPLASHEFIIVNYEDYQALKRTFLVSQTKNTNQKGHNFSPTDLPLVPQTNGLAPQTSHKSLRLETSPTDYSLGTNQLAELNNKRINCIKEVIAAPTPDELQMLDILRPLKGWRYDETDDLAWLRQFGIEFPQLGVVVVVFKNLVKEHHFRKLNCRELPYAQDSHFVCTEVVYEITYLMGAPILPWYVVSLPPAIQEVIDQGILLEV